MVCKIIVPKQNKDTTGRLIEDATMFCQLPTFWKMFGLCRKLQQINENFERSHFCIAGCHGSQVYTLHLSNFSFFTSRNKSNIRYTIDQINCTRNWSRKIKTSVCADEIIMRCSIQNVKISTNCIISLIYEAKVETKKSL